MRHPDYNPPDNNPPSPFLDNDFALLILPASRPVNDIVPVTLNQDTSVPSAGDLVEAMGWGGGSTNPNIPWTVDLSYISNVQCNDTYTAATEISDNMLCAFEDEGAKATCGGDSGK